MAKKNEGCFMIAVIWAVLVTVYYIFLFDYKHKTFSWLDSLIAISAVGVLIGSANRFSNNDDNNAE